MATTSCPTPGWCQSPQPDWYQLRGVHAHDGDIRIGVIADQLRLLTAAIRQGHDEPGGVMHDVAIGHNKAVGRQEKARAVAPHVWGETWIRARRAALPAVHLNIDHCWAHAFRHTHHGLGIGIEDLRIGQRV
jgi:hypothetical protein